MASGEAANEQEATATTESHGNSSPKSPRFDMQREETVQSLRCRADLLASRNRFEEALALVDEAMRLEPQNPDLHLGKGQCLVRLGRTADATECFDFALRLDPKHVAEESKANLLMAEQRWEEAAACLRKVLDAQGTAASPQLSVELAKCLTEQGVQLKTAGQPRPQLFRDATQVCPSYSQAYFQIGVDFSEANDHTRAREMYTEAVRLNQGYVEAWNNLGCACRALQESDHAMEAYRMALKVNHNCKKTRENMAICLLEIGCRHLKDKSFKQASSTFKQALVYNSKNADIFFHLGVMYAESNKLDKAKVQYELATHFDEKHADAWNNQGVIHRREGNVEAATFCFQKALEANPKMNLASKNLGACYGAMGRMSESIKLTRIALESNPNDAEAYNNLALLLRDQADLETCVEHLDACLRLEPKNHHACSNRLMTLNYFSELTREEVFNEHRAFGEDLERRIPLDPPIWKSPGSGDGLLRIGYISPDFYRHSVSYFIHAALKHHDPTFAHITCYSDVASEDDKTQLFKGLVPRWRHIHGVPDAEVARMIREDGIDILVELTGHTGNNRLAMIARRPAPITVTWVGYPHTTGLTRVDYRISDEQVDPPDCPGLTTEKLVYMPECFLCYTPPENAPPIRLKPSQETYGCVTYGCFNNLSKVSPLTLNLWCRLLHEMPDARLFLKSKALLCPEVQAKFRKVFSAQGIEAHRVDLSGLQPHTGSHLSMYNYVDIALDTAPYAGTTTTCEALYMGVPVVTLKGRGIHAQNVGASLLATVQLGDLVANSEEEYVQKASELGRNVTRLGALRAGLRTRMERSPLCDGARHTSRLERLYANLAARGPSVATVTDSSEASLPPEPQ